MREGRGKCKNKIKNKKSEGEEKVGLIKF